MLFYPLAGSPAPYYGYAVLQVGWTLNYEIFFYVLFTFSLLFRRYPLLWLTSFILICVIGGAMIKGVPISRDPQHTIEFTRSYFRLATNPLLLEFLLGVMVAVLFARIQSRLTPCTACTVLSIGVLWLVWSIAHSKIHHHSVVNMGLPAAVLLFGLLAAEDKKVLRIPDRLGQLGNMSYSIYLIHLAAIIWTDRHIAAPWYVKWALEFICVWFISYYWYQWIEKPSIRLGRSLLRIFNHHLYQSA